MNTQDFININGKPLYFPGWQSPIDMSWEEHWEWGECRCPWRYNDRPVDHEVVFN